MWVLLMRHGDAIDQALAGSDASRWLTERGRAESLAAGALMGSRAPKIDRVFTSPYVRATQTAELALHAFAYSGTVSVLEDLVPHGPPPRILAAMQKQKPKHTVLLVGHEPSMHHLAEAFLGVASFADFEKSAVCAIEWTGKAGTFGWMLDPRKPAFVEDVRRFT